MLTKKKKSIVLVQGLVDDTLADVLKKKKQKDVFLLEGRTHLSETKKICRKMLSKKIVPTIIAANMSGFLFYKKLVKEIWIAYHLSDKNGALCDIGGLILGVLGKRHNIPVYLYPAGQKTRLMAEQKEILSFNGVRVAPQGIVGYSPLVEWVPKKYFSKITLKQGK